VVVLLVLLGVLVLAAGVADAVARRLAERELAAQIRSSQQLPAPPEVTIRGWPFLTQVLAGRYQQIDVRIQQFPVQQGVRVQGLDAQLRGVRVGLGELLRGSVQEIPVGAVQAAGRVGLQDLADAVQRQLPGVLENVSLTPRGNGTLLVTGTYTGFGGPLPVRGEVRLSVDGGQLRLAVRPESLTSVPEPFRTEIVRLLTVSVDLPDLPFGLRVLGVDVDADGVVLRVGGTGVVLTPG